LLRPGRRTGFLTILPAAGLTRADYQRAIRRGPRAVATRRRQLEEMLDTAGFVDIQAQDVTGLWRQSTHGLITEQDRHAEALTEIVGRQALRERQRDLRRSLRAIDEGLLERKLFSATRPR